ncbi:Amidase [Sulfuricurvum kujiense DSM 16994]|uniref:Amidase n=1 Tax=Sulfuricurvum kujiense (strain ATCC BAA-921 / DSM 16994 / JCM 11577 / YK-1) TaxID=709032 RepID=E4TXD1_SULKY|nr:amidase [Sulfuricurvum kujiense]ADR32828.1 Amidase [Sulfuricurvum kujiense DSM 16994]
MRLSDCTATELLERLKTNSTTPKEIAQSCIERIRAIDPMVNAWEYFDEAAIEAQLAKIGTYNRDDYPLYGIPVGVKDIYNTFDMPTQMGSPLWSDFTPGNDARMIHYLRRSGAVMLGKTVTAEFAVHYQDKTRNPHDLSRSPGTSSSGSAVAVATGMVPVALGSQTAGSISRPASYCGIYGFKPTFGVLPRIGVLKTTDSLDTLGFFARSVSDLALMFEASRVHGENYEFVHQYIDNYVSVPDKVYRIGIIKHPKWDLASESAKNAFEAWCARLKSPCLQVQTVTLPQFCDTIHATHQTIYDKSLAYYFKEEYAKHTLMSPIFYDIIQDGLRITKEEYQDALEKQSRETREFDAWMDSYDILITLATADEAPIGLTTSDIPDANLIWTYLGLPIATLPVLKGENHLPIGVSAVSRKYNDKLLLDFLQYLALLGILPMVSPITPNSKSKE